MKKSKIRNFFYHFPADLKSGFILFLIALPLSVGISIASGAPPSAGLFSAIIGGICGSLLGGSEVTINGPAAGLIVVVLSAVESLGQGNQTAGFRYMLAATVFAGVLQILMGVFKLARIGLAFPSSVIHGMLSAIGAIIIIKQVPILLGYKMGVINPQVAFIGVVSLFILFVMPRLPLKFMTKIPAPLVTVIFGIFLGQYFDLEHEHIVKFLSWKAEVNRSFLLNIPSNIRDSLVFPDFSKAFTLANIVAVISISVIASIESVLSTFAVDKLDPEKRTSNLNRDLLSKGICNCILGFIGGLPIISEIVRSSANVANGAKTRMANFFHGFFILIFLILFPEVLHEIPMAALAGILIFVGWRLAHPSQFKHAFHIGPDHIFSFLVTFTMTLTTDLLIGVVSGVVAEILISFLHGVKPGEFFKLQYKTQISSGRTVFTVSSPLLFANSLKLRNLLEEQLNSKKNVQLDLSLCSFVDHTVLDQLDRMKSAFLDKSLTLECLFDELSHQPISKHPLASRRKAS